MGSPEHVYDTVSYGGADWTVVSVGDRAFDGCGSLTAADLPSATYVGKDAFFDCDSLTTADLRSATYVGDHAFEGCGSLTTADLRSAKSVGDGAFQGCDSLEYVDMSSSTTIGDSALYQCDALKHVRFSDELESVGSYAFMVFFYSGSERLAVDADSLRGRTFTGDGDRRLYESFEISWLDDAGALADTTFARKGETPSHDGLTKEPTDCTRTSSRDGARTPGPP